MGFSEVLSLPIILLFRWLLLFHTLRARALTVHEKRFEMSIYQAAIHVQYLFRFLDLSLSLSLSIALLLPFPIVLFVRSHFRIKMNKKSEQQQQKHQQQRKSTMCVVIYTHRPFSLSSFVGFSQSNRRRISIASVCVGTE